MAAHDPKLELHVAVWDDNLDLLQHLLEAGGFDLEYKDSHANTALLLAYRMGRTKAARMLLAAGADAKVRTAEGFEAIHAAALTANPDVVREAVLAYLTETDAAFERRMPALQKTLESTPDFELRMAWSFNSWIPLVSRLLPNDVFTIYKRGSSLRLDSTLLAMNGLTWDRGNISLILQGSDMPQPGSSFVLDHDMKTAANARLAFQSPTDQSQQDWVRKLCTAKIKTTDWWSRDAVFAPQLRRSGGVSGMLGSVTRGLGSMLLGGGGGEDASPRGRMSEGTPEPADDKAGSGGGGAEEQACEPAGLSREDVGVWGSCGVYTLRNLCVRDTTHPPVLPEASLPLKAWWKPEYSRQVGAQKAPGDAGGSPTSATAAPGATGAAPAAAAAAAAAAPVAEEEAPERKLGLLHRALRAIREGRVDELAGTRDAVELEGMYSGHAEGSGASLEGGRKVGYPTAFYSFSEYFGAPRPMPPLGGRPPKEVPPVYLHSDGKLHRPNGAVGEFKPPNLTTEDKALDLTMKFSKDFPITLEQFLPIAEVMARTASHAANFKRFLSRKMPRGAGFPVQLSLPVFPTITATVTFEYCQAHRSPPKALFELPGDYDQTGYVERGWIRQL